jgi:hypothetical protein
MAIYLVTYDLKQPGRDYQPVYHYLKKFIYCRGLESAWLVESTLAAATIGDTLKTLVDPNDVVLVVRIYPSWSTSDYSCTTWLDDPQRSW